MPSSNCGPQWTEAFLEAVAEKSEFTAFSAAFALYWNYKFLRFAWSSLKAAAIFLSRFTPHWFIDYHRRGEKMKQEKNQEKIELEKLRC